MPETKIIVEKDIRRIVREESLKIIKEEMLIIKDELKRQGDILSRLERLLLGETGSSADETLKWRANFAYQYAKMNSENNLVERAESALEWFDNMCDAQPGEKEPKLESLGKLITFYNNIRWLLTLIGVTTVINALPIIKAILEWVENISI